MSRTPSLNIDPPYPAREYRIDHDSFMINDKPLGHVLLFRSTSKGNKERSTTTIFLTQEIGERPTRESRPKQQKLHGEKGTDRPLDLGSDSSGLSICATTLCESCGFGRNAIELTLNYQSYWSYSLRNPLSDEVVQSRRAKNRSPDLHVRCER